QHLLDLVNAGQEGGVGWLLPGGYRLLLLVSRYPQRELRAHWFLRLVLLDCVLGSGNLNLVRVCPQLRFGHRASLGYSELISVWGSLPSGHPSPARKRTLQLTPGAEQTLSDVLMEVCHLHQLLAQRQSRRHSSGSRYFGIASLM